MPKAVIVWSTGERGGRHANGGGAGGACISVPRHCCKLQDAASCCGGEGGQQHTCAYQQAFALGATLGGNECGDAGSVRRRRTAGVCISAVGGGGGWGWGAGSMMEGKAVRVASKRTWWCVSAKPFEVGKYGHPSPCGGISVWEC